MILPAWFDHREDSFSYKKVQFKKFCPTVKSFVLLLKTLMIPLPKEIKMVNEKYRDNIFIFLPRAQKIASNNPELKKKRI